MQNSGLWTSVKQDLRCLDFYANQNFECLDFCSYEDFGY